MFDSAEFSHDDKFTLNLLEIIFMPERINDFKCFGIINVRFLVAVLLKKDGKLIQLMQKYYQQGLLTIADRFNELSAIEPARKLDYIRNYLCILPYFEFQQGTKLDVPWFDDEQKSWKLKTFQMNKILLNQQYFWMNQADLCYAYGLTEENGLSKSLILSGTTYPCGEGFWPHVINDISIGFDVGYFLYQNGKGAMLDFLGDCPNYCEVLGTSLGGAMALQLGLDCPNLKMVYALNPPGRIAPLKETVPTAPSVVVMQANDFVSKFGYWHPQWSIIHYEFNSEANRPAHFFDHISNYALLPNLTRQKLNTAELNQKRFWATAGIFIGLRGLCTIILVWPIRYLIVPILKLIYAMMSTVLDCLSGQDEAATHATSLDFS